MKLGNLDIKGIYVGSTPAAQMYVGTTKVWPEDQPQPVSVNAVRFQNVGNTTGVVQLVPNDQLSGRADWEYSSDGSTWTAWDKTNTYLSVDSGNSMYVRAGSIGQTALATGDSFNHANKILPTQSNFKVSGNLLYLLNQEGAASSGTLPRYQFTGLFLQGTGIVDASELQLPDRVGQYAFSRAFGVCTNLTAAPALPATTLSGANYCYEFMFGQCTSLSTPPALSARTLESNCYENMFYECTSLTATPQLVENTKSYCYSGMFYGCTSLTQVPNLYPYATSTGCYANMFNGCTGLTNAGIIPTGNDYMYSDAYMQMFANCTNITAVSFPTADKSDLKFYIKNNSAGLGSIFEGCDPSTIWVTYNGGAGWLSALMPELEGVKFTNVDMYGYPATVQITDVGDASNNGGVCDVVYSMDGENWNAYTLEDVITLQGQNDYVIFKANSSSGSGIKSVSDSSYYKFVVSQDNVLVEGDLAYLYSNDPKNNYMEGDYQFSHLFENCSFVANSSIASMYSSLKMPEEARWMATGHSYVFSNIFANATLARITIPVDSNGYTNGWNSNNAYSDWVYGISDGGEGGIMTIPSYFSIEYGYSWIPSSWSYEQTS